MKGIVCACLLASLPSMAQAFEADIHYSTTYVLARAVGWTQADALTIASANQGVDENEDTVAALEVDASPGLVHVTKSLHQADKNLRLHCFSKTGAPAGQVSADVLELISTRLAGVPGRGESPRRHATGLIALGAALHCQQDAYAHVGFGGSCGSHSGSCLGHTYQTLLDQVVFSLLKKHQYNPDHPGVSGRWLLEALQGTASELALRRPKASVQSIPGKRLAALSDELRGSGLELPDEVRRECNRHIAGKWLFDFLHAGARMQGNPDSTEKLAPEVARTCRNASLASAITVKIPEPRYPRLNADATPYLVKADGTYQLLRDRDFDTRIAALLPNYSPRRVKVQLSHWSQLLDLPRMAQVTPLAAHNTVR
jgi:hypothetical protein